MNLSGAHLLDKPRTRVPEVINRGLVIPTIEEQVDFWREEFEEEKREREEKTRRIYREQMSNNSWVGMLNPLSQTVTGATFSGTAITDISPAPDFTMPAGIPAGTMLRLTASGQFVATGSSTTLTLQFMYGGTGGTSLYTTGAVTITASATNTFHLEALVRIMTAGTSGTATVWGRQQGVSTTANIGVPVQATTTSVSLNTTTANAIIVAATAGVAFTSVIIYHFAIEQLN